MLGFHRVLHERDSMKDIKVVTLLNEKMAFHVCYEPSKYIEQQAIFKENRF